MFLPLAALLGCVGPKSQVIENDGDFRAYHCVGVAPFIDPRGQGQIVANEIEAGLQLLKYAPVDQRALAQALVSNMPNSSFQLGIEPLERIHEKVPVDAIIFGRLTPDWSTALLTVNETEMGGAILQIVLRPGRKEKAFDSAHSVATEALRVLASLR